MEATNTTPITLHVGFETIQQNGEQSPHERQRVTKILKASIERTNVIHLSSCCGEALRNCTRIHPNFALLSAQLPSSEGVTFHELVCVLSDIQIKVVVLYKLSETNPEEIWLTHRIPGIPCIRVNELKQQFPSLLTK